MRSRQEIKAIGKEQFKLNYWNCVLAALLVTAVLGVISWMSNGQEIARVVSTGQDAFRVVSGQQETIEIISSQPVQSTVSVRSNAGGLLMLLLGGPITVGLNYFFVKNVRGERDELSVTTPFSEAFRNYPRKLGGSLWMGLFVFLWSLLLVIPGLIAAYLLVRRASVQRTAARPSDTLNARADVRMSLQNQRLIKSTKHRRESSSGGRIGGGGGFSGGGGGGGHGGGGSGGGHGF